jgi:transcriptional regulator with GAF, ATPase, and Fis domain
MENDSLDLYRLLFEDLDPEKITTRFVKLLMGIQNVERGSIWVRRGNRYLCIESLGRNPIKGVSIPANQPSIVGWVIENARLTIAEPFKDPRHYKEAEKGSKSKSTCILCYPLILKNGEVYGAVQIIDTSAGGNRLNLNESFLSLLKKVVDVGAIALSNAIYYKKQLKKNLELERALEDIRSETKIIGRSRVILNVMKKVQDFAQTDFAVLITGESGTGKDLVAEALHDLSPRKHRNYIVQNCSAISEGLLESELFGLRKGAFTGATENKMGLLEAAHGGTVFLDEVGDMSLNLQARLLRAIQNKEIKRLGEVKNRKIDVRIISSTNKDLKKAVANGAFREDLFYRINVLPIHLPPLRERKEDIPLLLNYFLRKESLRLGIPRKVFSKEALQYLAEFPWYGNIRELENLVKYVLTSVEHVVVDVDEIPDQYKHNDIAKRGTIDASLFCDEQGGLNNSISQIKTGSPFDHYSWRELDKAYVLHLLDKHRWNVTRAAKETGVNRSTFDSRMKRLGIDKHVS